MIELKTQQKRAEENLTMLRRRLQQVSQQFEQEKKQLEGEITGLIRARAKLRAQVSSANEEALDFQRPAVIVSIKPDDSKADAVRSVRGMMGRFQQTDDGMKQRMNELKDQKMKYDSELKLEKQRLVLQLEKEHKTLNSLDDETRLLKIRRDELVARLRVTDSHKKSEQKKAEADLQSQILLQRDAICEFHEEIEKLRVDEEGQRGLRELQNRHNNEMVEMHSKIDTFEDAISQMISDKVKGFETTIAEEREKSKALIQRAYSRLDEMLRQLAAIKAEMEKETMKERKRWGTLRRDLADSNLKMANWLVKSDSRPSSGASGRWPQLSPLPKLGRRVI
jgi:DNA repair exonuclease SbcCD ATPase subunit